MLSRDCIVRDNDGHSITFSNGTTNKSKPIVIGSNVWLAERVTILKGVTIGSNVVIGFGTIVTKSIPDNVTVVNEIVHRFTSLSCWKR